MELISLLASDRSIRRAAEGALGGRRVLLRGSQGSSFVFTAAALAERAGRHVVLAVAHGDDADETEEQLRGASFPVLRLPALESSSGGDGPALDLFAQRLSAVRRAAELGAEGASPTVVVCPVQALMQRVPRPEELEGLSLRISRGDRVSPGDVVRWLDGGGYKRVDAVEEPGDFAVRGGIVDVFPPGGAAFVGGAGASGGEGEAAAPVRIDFFGDEADRITEIDLDTMASDRELAGVELVSADPQRAAASEAGGVSFLELLPRRAIAVLHETLELTEQARGYYERLIDGGRAIPPPEVFGALQKRFASVVELNQFSDPRTGADESVELPVEPLPGFAREAGEAVRELRAMTGGEDAHRVLVYCRNDGERARMLELASEFIPEQAPAVETVRAYVHRGFVWRLSGERGALALVPYHELLHRFETHRRVRRLRSARAMDTFLDLQVGDYVVHRDHGIAKFVGLKVMEPGGARLGAASLLRNNRADRGARRKGRGEELEEFLTLEFAQGSRLHVPATQIDLVQKYVGGFGGAPPLSALGGTRWQRQKAAAAESVRDLAAEMLRVRAAREHLPGVRFPSDTAWQREFEAEFPYEETEDQLSALAQIKRDMESERPMDRLLCGDVGYGKTELAIRAAFKAVEYGKQVAVLVPTTVLAEQHELTFRSRMADYPFRVESLSRFKTKKDADRVLGELAKGRVDVVIGTHRLLSPDVRFADLGLVIVDEEQRFGVEHKERLLSLRATVDVLTLSATPIPRTLHMSLLGLRDISSLATPPLDRRAVVTEVIPYNDHRIREAIARELGRDGQVFFVHNRVYNIHSVADRVRALAPDARVVVGHGQMSARELEKVMQAFMRRRADILVCTTIIESGIDIPTANTMFIDDADRFGLADLHQLRGRVGRYKHRAYCYMLLPRNRTVVPNAVRRLKAIEQYSMLGAGFKIAMRDLEIRGAGNLLGPEQSGHIAAVGYEMYCQLLERAVAELKNETTRVVSDTSVEIGVSGLLPKGYIPSDARRLDAYRRIAVAASGAELARVREELVQAYGEPPAPAQRLLDLSRLRVAASGLGVRSISVRERDVLLRAADPLPAAAALSDADGTVRVLEPKSGERLSEIYYRPPEILLRPPSLLRVLNRHLGAAAERAGEEDGAETGPREQAAGAGDSRGQ